MSEIFQTLIYHLIESTVWSILFIGLIPLIRLKDSKLRCWIYRIAIIKFLFPSVWLVSLIEVTPQEELVPLMIVFADPIQTFTSAAAPQTGFEYAIYLWGLVIVTILSYTFTLVYRFISEIQSESEPLNDTEQAVLKQALINMNQPEGSVCGFKADTKISIGLFGIFRPRIIAKHEFLEMLNERELIAAFQHEIAHKIRSDNVWRLALDLITSLFWFHPIVWYLKKKCLIETEKACDEQVIRAGQQTNTYANCLLKAAEYAHSNAYFCSTALSETSIKTRVSNILNYQKGNKQNMKTITIVATALALISGSFTLLAAAENGAPKKELYHISEVDVKPSPIHQIAPHYPKALKDQKIDGKVVLEFIIDQKGIVHEVHAVEPFPEHVEFIAPSVEALLQWKFTPGQVKGKFVKTKVKAPLLFQAVPPEKKKVKKSE